MKAKRKIGASHKAPRNRISADERERRKQDAFARLHQLLNETGRK